MTYSACFKHLLFYSSEIILLRSEKYDKIVIVVLLQTALLAEELQTRRDDSLQNPIELRVGK
jgi:hypothetical protein